MTDTNRSAATSGTGGNAGASSVSGKAKRTKRTERARKAVAKSLDAGAAKARASAKAIKRQSKAAVDTGAAAIDSAPLSALAGAIALGAVVAALIPNTTRELQAIGPLGNRVRGALDDAFAAAKTAGSEQLTAKGLTLAATSSGLGQLIGSIVQAAIAANKAADTSMRAASDKADHKTPPPQAS